MDVFANHRAYWKTGISVILMLAASVPASAQSDQQKTRVFTLEEAVDFALKNYPAVRVSLERLRSAEAGVTVARTSYLPRTDVLWQSNRATDNNITGLTLPNSVIAPITGPVPLATSNRSAWGSAGGLLFSWEPLDFGYRGARVDARSEEHTSELQSRLHLVCRLLLEKKKQHRLSGRRSRRRRTCRPSRRRLRPGHLPAVYGPRGRAPAAAYRLAGEDCGLRDCRGHAP